MESLSRPYALGQVFQARCGSLGSYAATVVAAKISVNKKLDSALSWLGAIGPDFVIGKATTRGFHQSVLSKRLNPPVKWSYRKLILWWALVFLSIGWIVFYINTGPKNSSAVLSPPLILFSGLSVVTFLLLLVLFWRHNQSTHERRHSQWERTFLCQRCDTLTEQE